MMRASLLSAAVLALGLCLSTGARADDPGQDEVALKNGGTIRGTVLTSEPGKSVKIVVMGEPQPRVVPWADVAEVKSGKYAPKPAQAEPPPPPAPPSLPPPPSSQPQPQPDPESVTVHLDSPVPATLIARYDVAVPEAVTWVSRHGWVHTGTQYDTVTNRKTLCTSPCKDDVRRDFTLFVVGQDLPSSPTFNLATRPSVVWVQVAPGSNGLWRGGIVAVVLGSLANLAGAIALPLNQARSTTTDLNTGVQVHVPNPSVGAASIGLIVGGATVLAGGVVMLVTGRTKVTVSDQPQQASATQTRTTAKPRYWLGEF